MLCLLSLVHHLFLLSFFFKLMGLMTLTKLNTEIRICRTKFGIVTFIFGQNTSHIGVIYIFGHYTLSYVMQVWTKNIIFSWET